MKKAVFFDIDGTLIDVSVGQIHISGKVRTALNDLKAAGHLIFIASGRPLDFLDAELVNFGFNGFVLMNGAVAVIDNKIIFKDAINQQIIRDVCSYCDKENIEYVLESHPKVYLHKHFKLLETFYDSIGIDTKKFERDFNIDDFSTYKIEFLTNRDDAGQLYYNLMQMPTLTGITDPFHCQNLELYAQKNSKASGILHVLDYLGIDLNQSYAFGDGLNDVEMIKTIGCGMAMENGNPKLKELAKYIVPSVQDDGVAYGIYNYILD